MNNRYNTRRGGNERERYEAERGNARSDRERYEFSDRDEGGYRGWGGGDFEDNDRRMQQEEHRGVSGRSDWGEQGRARGHQGDDRDRWGMRGEMDRWGGRGGRGDVDHEQMREGRGGYGLSSSNRNETGHWSREGREGGEGIGPRDWGRGHEGFRASSDYRGQGYGGVHGYEGREHEDDLGGRRPYGGSMGGWGEHGGPIQGGYGQYDQGGYGGQSGFGQGGPGGRHQRGMTQAGTNIGGMRGSGAWEGSWGRGDVGRPHSNMGGSTSWGATGLGPIERRRIGRGPKGYKRSDERIREDVCDQLGQTDDIDASDVEVNVQNGEVTLTGNVPDRRMKYIAEQLAERISGVNEIHNQLRVKREQMQAGSGTQQTQQAQQQGSSMSLQQSSMGTQGQGGTGNENGRRGNLSR